MSELAFLHMMGQLPQKPQLPMDNLMPGWTNQLVDAFVNSGGYEALAQPPTQYTYDNKNKVGNTYGGSNYGNQNHGQIGTTGGTTVGVGGSTQGSNTGNYGFGGGAADNSGGSIGHFGHGMAGESVNGGISNGDGTITMPDGSIVPDTRPSITGMGPAVPTPGGTSPGSAMPPQQGGWPGWGGSYGGGYGGWGMPPMFGGMSPFGYGMGLYGTFPQVSPYQGQGGMGGQGQGSYASYNWGMPQMSNYGRQNMYADRNWFGGGGG